MLNFYNITLNFTLAKMSTYTVIMRRYATSIGEDFCEQVRSTVKAANRKVISFMSFENITFIYRAF